MFTWLKNLFSSSSETPTEVTKVEEKPKVKKPAAIRTTKKVSPKPAPKANATKKRGRPAKKAE